MGRKKIPIATIAAKRGQQITFAKRRAGLVKKAYELSTLCNCEIGIIIFSASDKLYQYASSSMQDVLQRYMGTTRLQESLTNVDVASRVNGTGDSDLDMVDDNDEQDTDFGGGTDGGGGGAAAAGAAGAAGPAADFAAGGAAELAPGLPRSPAKRQRTRRRAVPVVAVSPYGSEGDAITLNPMSSVRLAHAPVAASDSGLRADGDFSSSPSRLSDPHAHRRDRDRDDDRDPTGLARDSLVHPWTEYSLLGLALPLPDVHGMLSNHGMLSSSRDHGDPAPAAPP